MDLFFRYLILSLIVGGLFNWLMKKPENLEVKDTYIVCCPIKFYIVFGLFFLFSFGISLFALYDYYKNSQIEVIIIFILFGVGALFFLSLLVLYKFKKIFVYKDNIVVKRLFRKPLKCNFNDIIEVYDCVELVKVKLKNGKSFKIDKIMVNSDVLREKISVII